MKFEWDEKNELLIYENMELISMKSMKFSTTLFLSNMIQDLIMGKSVILDWVLHTNVL